MAEQNRLVRIRSCCGYLFFLYRRRSRRNNDYGGDYNDYGSDYNDYGSDYNDYGSDYHHDHDYNNDCSCDHNYGS